MDAPVTPTKKVHIETWGCQMNIADSEQMLALLAERNYTLAAAPEDADLVLLNTCHIREKARHKIVSRLGVLRELKNKKPGMTIAVGGCVAQAEGARLIKEAPQIDVLFGPGKISELPRLLDEHAGSGKSAVEIGFSKVDRHGAESGHVHTHQSAAAPTITGKREISRYVNIQQGCDNFCTFCVVPFTRGRELSRLPQAILAEAKALVAAGARELTLLGQNVNSYGSDLVGDGSLPATPNGAFVDLLAQVAQLPGLERLRFTTSNPHDFTPALADLFRGEPKLGRYLHLPLQSGDDAVLARMRRKVTRAEYLERIAWLRATVPDMAFSTDLIVGFPGETEAEFAATLAIAQEIKFSFAFTFKYSPRRHTAAARFAEQIPEDVKEERLARLNALQDRITTAHHLAEVGRVRPVLLHYESNKYPGQYYGRTEHFRLVRVASARDIVGQVLPVRITHSNKTALLGELV